MIEFTEWVVTSNKPFYFEIRHKIEVAGLSVGLALRPKVLLEIRFVVGVRPAFHPCDSLEAAGLVNAENEDHVVNLLKVHLQFPRGLHGGGPNFLFERHLQVFMRVTFQYEVAGSSFENWRSAAHLTEDFTLVGEAKRLST